MFKVGDRVVSGHGYGTIIVIDQYGRGYWYLVGEVSKARPMFKGNKHATAN